MNGEQLYVFGCRMFIASKSKPEISPRWTTKEDLRVIMYQYSFAHDDLAIFPFLPIWDCGCCESVHLSAWSSASAEVSPVPPFRERYNDRILLPDEWPGGVFGFALSGDLRERRLWLRSRPSSLPGDFLRSSFCVLAFSINWLSTPRFGSVDLAVPYTTILPLESKTAPTPPDGVRHRVGISFVSV